MQGTSSHSQSLNGVLVIQYNWEENLRENENVWVYFKPLNEKSYHGNIGDNTFEILDKKNKAISIRYLPLNIQNNFVCPYKTLTDIHSKVLFLLMLQMEDWECLLVLAINYLFGKPEMVSVRNELEFGTEGKLLAIGCEVGKVIIMSVSARTILATHLTSSPVLSLCWLPNYFLILGLEDGRVMAVDCKKITEVPQLLCHDSASSILCVKPLKSGFVLGRRDGLCQFYTLDGTSKVQLTGSNCDPIYDVSVDSNFVYTACRDKTIRKYRIADMNI
ncbi:Proteasomal ATPase-associated factor 1 [Armadillidium vulgare]|nr:Proteasomal ATPase-associated factor 1 [Armadillidium vulgare]